MKKDGGRKGEGFFVWETDGKDMEEKDSITQPEPKLFRRTRINNTPDMLRLYIHTPTTPSSQKYLSVIHFIQPPTASIQTGGNRTFVPMRLPPSSILHNSTNGWMSFIDLL